MKKGSDLEVKLKALPSETLQGNCNTLIRSDACRVGLKEKRETKPLVEGKTSLEITMPQHDLGCFFKGTKDTSPCVPSKEDEGTIATQISDLTEITDFPLTVVRASR